SNWVRPFILAGYGVTVYRPTDEAESAAGNPANPLFGTPTGPVGLDSSTRGSFTYGGGLKARLTPRVGLRVDARGFLSRTPFFALPRNGPPGTLVIQGRPSFNAFQITAGLTFYPDGSSSGATGRFPQVPWQGGELVELNLYGGGSFFRGQE